MNKFYTSILIMLLGFSMCLESSAITSGTKPQPPMPDTIGGTNGWRYATPADEAYWPNVTEGDVLLFGKTDQAGQREIYTNKGPYEIEGGQKIHLWRGKYGKIGILGTPTNPSGFDESNSSSTNPVIITNLGGQVEFGGPGSQNFAISGLRHVFVTGEYNESMGTGDENFLGMDGDLTSHGWINRFGIFGDRKYAEYPDPGGTPGCQIDGFISAKIRGMAVLHGYFSGFQIKNNDQVVTTYTTIDIQKCLSGWHTSEGFYLGYTGSANSASHNLIICKNNVALFTGGEGIQTDKLSTGSEIKNNFVYKTGCFYQFPFQGDQLQDNCFQWSFVQGGVVAEDNIFYGGTASNLVNHSGIEQKTGVTISASEIHFTNNLLGQSLSAWGYMKNSLAADPQGLISFHITENVVDYITPTVTNDAYDEPDDFPAFLKIANTKNPIFLTNNVYPLGRPIYQYSGAPPNPINVQSTGNTQATATPLLMDDNFGFDPSEILAFRGVWHTGNYGGALIKTGGIPYAVDDMVYMQANNKTTYYRCILAHSVANRPDQEPTMYWEKILWDGKEEPAYTPLLQEGSEYKNRGMGLNYSQPEPPGGGSSVTWVDLVGVSVDGNNNLTKTAAYGENNGGAASQEVLAAGAPGWVEMEIDQTNHLRILGLSDVNTDATLATMDYTFLFDDGVPLVQVWENGSNKKSLGPYVVGEVYRIEREGTSILYKRNGVIIWTSAIPSSTSLLVDVALYHVGGRIYNCNLSFGAPPDPAPPITWVNKVGVNEDEAGSLIKTSAYGDGNGGAASQEVLAAGVDGWVEMELDQTGYLRLLALSEVDTDATMASMDYAILFDNDLPPVAQVWEYGNRIEDLFVYYSVGEVYRIERTDNTIEYKKNGVIFYTSQIPSTTDLLVDVTIFHPGGTIYNADISFGAGGGGGGGRVASTEQAILKKENNEEMFDTDPYPNPIYSTSVLSIGFSEEIKGDVAIEFMDVTGRSEWRGMVKGSSVIRLEMQPLNLSPGMKFLRVVRPDGIRMVKKIQKLD